MASITSFVCAALVGAVMTVGSGRAHAQAALDDDDATPTPTTTQSTADPNATHVGVDLRLRNVWVPKSLLQLFVDTAPGGASDFGIGADVFRRKGNFEVQFGLEYEKIFIDKGIWVEKDKLPPQETVDYVRFDNFGWITAEVTFLNHTPITKFLSLRYGGGAGLGVLFGHVRRTDYTCTSADLASCHSDPMPNNDTPYNLPPVFPVINAIVGVQIKPVENIVINVEGGIRTIPFFGTSIGYVF